MGLDYLTKQDAEKLSGKKLDGRRKYYLWDDIVCVTEKYTGVCSGCSSDDPYITESRGCGCQECGYTGKRINYFPCPVNPKQVK